jgi:membrane protein implicated in regulation of membrane protease activity
MDIQLLWWYWIAFGLLLILAEIFLVSFTIFWFGLAAIVVGLLLWFVPDIALSWQLLGWALFSIGFAILWFRYFKPTMRDRTKAGISREAVQGETGLVVRLAQENQRGLVRFAMPLLGDDEWEFFCNDQLSIGDRVIVIDVSGNTLVVSKKGN